MIPPSIPEEDRPDDYQRRMPPLHKFYTLQNLSIFVYKRMHVFHFMGI